MDVPCPLLWVDRALVGWEFDRHQLAGDALLDLRGALLSSDSGLVWETFCKARELAENIDYLLFYRLRRWVEQAFVIHVSDGDRESPFPLEADFREAEKALRRAKWQWFEMSEGEVRMADISARVTWR